MKKITGVVWLIFRGLFFRATQRLGKNTISGWTLANTIDERGRQSYIVVIRIFLRRFFSNTVFRLDAEWRKGGKDAVIKMKLRDIGLLVCIVILPCLSFFSAAFGAGFDNSAIGAQGSAMGNALTGIADDASAVHFNPAGMVNHDDNNWMGEVYTIVTFTNFQYTANHIEDKSKEIYILPGFFLSKAFDGWAVGFGFYTPYAGGGTIYDNFQKSSYDMEYFAAFNALTTAFAYKISPDLSFGVGLSIYTGAMESEFFNPILGAVQKSEYDEIIAGYGGHMGFLYHPTDKLGIGFVARTPVPIEMDGEEKIGNVTYDSELEMTFPCSFDLGFGYQPDAKNTFGLVFSFRLWGDMDDITIKNSGLDTKQKTYYENSWLIGMGMTHQISEKYSVKTMMKYIQGATSDKGLIAGSNDIDVLTGAVSMGYRIRKTTELIAVFSYLYGFEKEVDSKKYDQDHIVFALGVRF